MIKFRKDSAMLSFCGKYYKREAKKNIDEKGLNIYWFESVWLADLVSTFLLENSLQNFADIKYFGIYRDSGIFISFSQTSIKELAEGDSLQFTLGVWKVDRSSRNLLKKLKIITESNYPYLGMHIP